MASTSSVHVDVAVQAAAMAVLQRVVQQRRQGGRPRFSRYRSTGARPRQRVQVKDIYEQLGPTYFKRSYRMKYQSFKKLARKLHHGIIRFSLKNRFVRNYRYVPNGPITTSVRLACALRYFAGGSVYDLMTTYHLGHTDTMRSIWYVVLKTLNSHNVLIRKSKMFTHIPASTI